ncbi:TPA: hypothetical protein O5T43_002517 [Staphylococcus aureus]|nr:hypothetical protein [Staphylococcus aureus]
MIERMARAAFNAHSQRGEDHWVNADPIQRDTKIREMTAALTAMREPLGVMEGAGNLEIDRQRTNEGGTLYRKARASKIVWQAMIDAALIWPPGSADIAGVPMARD